MKKLLLIAVFLFSTFILQASNNEYLVVQVITIESRYNIQYNLDGEEHKFKSNLKSLNSDLQSCLNDLSNNGWTVKSSSNGESVLLVILERVKK